MSSDRKSSHACKSCQSKKTRCQVPEGENACYKCLQKGIQCSFGAPVHWTNPPKYCGYSNTPGATSSPYHNAGAASSSPAYTGMPCGYCTQRRVQCDGGAPCSQCTMSGYTCPSYSASQSQAYAGNATGYGGHYQASQQTSSSYYTGGMPQSYQGCSCQNCQAGYTSSCLCSPTNGHCGCLSTSAGYGQWR